MAADISSNTTNPTLIQYKSSSVTPIILSIGLGFVLYTLLQIGDNTLILILLHILYYYNSNISAGHCGSYAPSLVSKITVSDSTDRNVCH